MRFVLRKKSMLARTFGSAVYGVNAYKIAIEVNADKGTLVSMVGLPDAAVKEAQQRIRAALINSDLKHPVRNYTINMAPADIRKEGTAYDLPLALGLLAAFEKVGGRGVAAPSANRFGHVSPTNAAAVVEEIGKYLTKEDLVLDGGPCHVGVESTIIDCTGTSPRILRPGAISELMIEECTGLPVLAGNLLTKGAEDIRVSGSLENHYAPAAKVFLNQSPVPGQGFIADSSIKTPEGVIRLASPNNDEEFARLLYSALRAADAKGLSEVVVMQPIGAGIAVAIRDRLARAAKGR